MNKIKTTVLPVSTTIAPKSPSSTDIPEFYALTVDGVWRVTEHSVVLVHVPPSSNRIVGERLRRGRFVAVTSQFIGLCNQIARTGAKEVVLRPWEELPVAYRGETTPALIGLFCRLEDAQAFSRRDLESDKHRAEDATMEVLKKIGPHHHNFIVSRPTKYGFNQWWYPKHIGIDRVYDNVVLMSEICSADLEFDEPESSPVREGRPTQLKDSIVNLRTFVAPKKMVMHKKRSTRKGVTRTLSRSMPQGKGQAKQKSRVAPAVGMFPMKKNTSLEAVSLSMNSTKLTGNRYCFEFFEDKKLSYVDDGIIRSEVVFKGKHIMVRRPSPIGESDSWWVVENLLPRFVGRRCSMLEYWIACDDERKVIRVTSAS